MANENPLDILNRRLAAGEITVDDYDELKARISGAKDDDQSGSTTNNLDRDDNYEQINEVLSDDHNTADLENTDEIVNLARERLKYFASFIVALSISFAVIAWPIVVLPLMANIFDKDGFVVQLLVQIVGSSAPALLGFLTIIVGACLGATFVSIISQGLISRLNFFRWPAGKGVQNGLRELEKGSLSSRLQDISKSYSELVVASMGDGGGFVYNIRFLRLVMANVIILLVASMIMNWF